MLNIEPLSLSPEEALATSSYLKNVADGSPGLSVAVQSLFGRCCAGTLPGCPNLANSLAEEAGGLSRRILGESQSDDLNLDPLLLVETYNVLREQGAEAAYLRRVLVDIAARLTEQAVETQRFGRVRRIAAALRTAGFDVPVANPTKGMDSLLASPEKWFAVSTDELTEIAAHITAEHLCLDGFSSQILALLALAELRNYRIDLGCTLLRATFEHGEACVESVEALNFIALQRRRDGRYGFPNQFAESTEPPADPHLTMYLPLTVHAVWLFRIAARSKNGTQSPVRNETV